MVSLFLLGGMAWGGVSPLKAQSHPILYAGSEYYSSARSLVVSVTGTNGAEAFARSANEFASSAALEGYKPLTGPDATSQNILQRIKDLQHGKADERVIVDIIAHGTLSKKGKPCVVAFNHVPGSEIGLLDMEDIVREFLNIKAKHKWLIIDACYAGSLQMRFEPSGGSADLNKVKHERGASIWLGSYPGKTTSFSPSGLTDFHHAICDGLARLGPVVRLTDLEALVGEDKKARFVAGGQGNHRQMYLGTSFSDKFASAFNIAISPYAKSQKELDEEIAWATAEAMDESRSVQERTTSKISLANLLVARSQVSREATSDLKQARNMLESAIKPLTPGDGNRVPCLIALIALYVNYPVNERLARLDELSQELEGDLPVLRDADRNLYVTACAHVAVSKLHLIFSNHSDTPVQSLGRKALELYGKARDESIPGTRQWGILTVDLALAHALLTRVGVPNDSQRGIKNDYERAERYFKEAGQAFSKESYPTEWRLLRRHESAFLMGVKGRLDDAKSAASNAKDIDGDRFPIDSLMANVAFEVSEMQSNPSLEGDEFDKHLNILRSLLKGIGSYANPGVRMLLANDAAAVIAKMDREVPDDIIKTLLESKDLLTYEAAPEYWLAIRSNISTIYGNSHRNAESMDTANEALKLIQKERMPALWATATFNRDAAQQNTIGSELQAESIPSEKRMGEMKTGLQDVASDYNEIESIWKEADDQRVPDLLYNRGSCLSDLSFVQHQLKDGSARESMDQAVNDLKAAIFAWESRASERDFEAYRIRRIIAMGNLAQACFRSKELGAWPERFALGVKSCEDALAEIRPSDPPIYRTLIESMKAALIDLNKSM